MVASVSADLYSPFQHPVIPEEGHQSSEDGSGLHSPVYGAQVNGDSFRYHDQLDVQHAAGILAAHFDYPTLNVQHPPLINPTVEIPRPSPQHLSFPSTFPLSGHTQPDLEFPIQSPVHSPISPQSQSSVVDYSYGQATGRRLPDTQSYDQAYTRTGPSINPSISSSVVEAPQQPSPASPTEPLVAIARPNPTVPRRESSSAVIACRQCRGRKIRCDSTRPVCNNCVRRSNVCEYDAVPKRRGPDKRPGTRQRSCKKRPADGSEPPPKRKRTVSDRSMDKDSLSSKVKENMAEAKQPSTSTPASQQQQHQADRVQDAYVSGHGPHLYSTDLRISTGASLVSKLDTSAHRHAYDQFSYIKPSYPRQLDVNTLQTERSHHKFPVPSSPVVESDQKIWWDAFLQTYPVGQIVQDLDYLFTECDHYLSFYNKTFFESTIKSPEGRLRIQPAFVLAALALATLMKSSDVEYGLQGRSKALQFRDSAQRALENAWKSEWIDATLAEAALILALFETSPHPEYHPDRASASLVFLDSIIQNLGLTTIDVHDPDVARFPESGVPRVDIPSADDYHHQRTCSCIMRGAPQPPDLYTNWSYPLPWDSSWNSFQIRDEECRRLCWNALSLITTHSVQCAAFDRECSKLFLTDPSNYLLLFPGEVMDRVAPNYRSVESHSTKESVWALYCRSMLLWNFCNRYRHSNQFSEEDKAEFSHEAWNESQFILDSLNKHQCNLDTGLIYMTREYLFNARMEITRALRSLSGLDSGSPIFNRKQADEWVLYQEQVVKRVISSIQQVGQTPEHLLTRRPFQVTWFTNQLALCFRVWNADRSNLKVLELAKQFLVVVDVMAFLWPCQVIQQQSADMRQRLNEACRLVGLEQPLPSNYPLSPMLRSS